MYLQGAVTRAVPLRPNPHRTYGGAEKHVVPGCRHLLGHAG